jgi:hypothetical protein
MRRRNAIFDLLFFGRNVYEIFERRKAAVLGTIVALFALALMSCAPSRVQIQAAQRAIAAMPPQVLLVPPAIANEPGYLELSASVTNQSRSPILGLTQPDFIVDTSGVRVPIAFFREKPRTPMSIGILIDTSGSMILKLDMVKLGLAGFIEGLNPSEEVFLIAFSAKPHMLQPLTTDHHAAVQRLSQLNAFGQTSIYD